LVYKKINDDTASLEKALKISLILDLVVRILLSPFFNRLVFPSIHLFTGSFRLLIIKTSPKTGNKNLEIVYVTQAFLVWYKRFPDGCLNKAGE